MRAIAAVLIWIFVSSAPLAAQSAAVERSIRPAVRPVTVVPDSVVPTSAVAMRDAGGFAAWVAGFRKRALAAGIGGTVFDRAFRDVRYDAAVIGKDRNQSEFTRQIWDYLDAAVSVDRVETGRALLAEHGRLLAEIEARHGVEKEVVAAIWGLESRYGAVRGSTPIIQALASLAYDARRSAFFEAQLIAALEILQSGDVGPGDMTGSWAGAMGHTQFMPTSYLAHAVDHDGDGRRDIWGDDPADALASTAAYLRHFGWTRGQPWGVEVVLPRGFDHAAASRRTRLPASDWARIGVRTAGGGPLPDWREASVLLPAGHGGPAFLVYPNIRVIERYNPADAYVIAVGVLADRLRGGPGIRADWPRGDRALSFAEKQEMQRRLLAKGFDPAGVDGIVGPRTIAAVRAFQASAGMVPDGYASLKLLERLRGG